MLGSLIDRPRWHWTIWGKHPAAADYLNIGLATQVEQAISNWIQKGYSRLNTGENIPSTPCVWRFWTQVTGNHVIACGIISDSSDQIGRPFPLLVMGTGRLKDWEQYWEYLPMGLESTWRQMEQLSASRAKQSGELKQALDRLQPPVPSWSDLKKRRAIAPKSLTPLLPETKRLHQGQVRQTDKKPVDSCRIVPLTGDPTDAANEWHRQEKAQHRYAPNSLFIGGPPDLPFLAAFTRALSPLDFVRLWALGRRKSRQRHGGIAMTEK